MDLTIERRKNHSPSPINNTGQGFNSFSPAQQTTLPLGDKTINM